MIFDSRIEKYKYPFGAVKTGERVRFTFPCEDTRFVLSVRMFVRRGDRAEVHPMIYIGKEGNFSLFEVKISLTDAGIYYYRFEVRTHSGIEYYGKEKNGSRAVCGEWLDEWQLTVYDSSYSTPDSFKGGVIYHIFADRFYRAGDRKKGVFHDNWFDLPNIESDDGKYHADDFFGGDLKGIEEKLPYLESLGVTVIYLSPIFKAYSNHRYDTGNYLEIDPLLGDEKDFESLCREADKRGISIMLDGVFNHSGSDSLYFNKHGSYDSVGAYNSIDSPYHDWYYFETFPKGYRSWWGIRNVPTLNKDNEDYRKLVFGENGVIDKWTKLGASAWRLDVADELPSEFIKNIRKRLKNINNNALLIGEVWEDASTKCSYGTYRPYLLGEELDGVMNYPFMKATLDYTKGGDKEKFISAVMSIVENYPKEALDTTMTFIGTHDTVRALNALSNKEMPHAKEEQRADRLSDEERVRAEKLLKIASVIEFTLPGIPSIFYGDEAGLEGWADPLNRGTYPWGREKVQLIEHYKKLGNIRKNNRNVFCGRIEFVESDCLEYVRFSGNDKLRVVVNNSKEEKECKTFGKDLISGENINGKIGAYTACIVKQ